MKERGCSLSYVLPKDTLTIDLKCNVMNVLPVSLLVKWKRNEITSLHMETPPKFIFILKRDWITWLFQAFRKVRNV